MFCFICLAILFLILASILFNLLRQKLKLPGFMSKSVVVTGCDSGFGHWLAMKLIENRIKVFAGCYTATGQRNLKSKVIGPYTEYLASFPLDVSSQESVDKAAEFVTNALDRKRELRLCPWIRLSLPSIWVDSSLLLVKKSHNCRLTSVGSFA